MGRREGAVGVSLIAKGILQQNDEKRAFRQRVEAALAEEQIKSMFPKQVYDIDETGNLRNLGNVPQGAQVIRDRQLGPLDQLRSGILNAQRDISQPSLMETQINQLGQIPGSEQQIGLLQKQYGDSILKQQQAQAQLPMLQQQSKALQEAGLLNPSLGGFGGFDSFDSDVNSETVVVIDKDGEVVSIPIANLKEALRRGARLAQ